MNTLDYQELQKYLDSTTASKLPLWVEKNRPQISNVDSNDKKIREHVSVNIQLDRFYHFLETGELEQFDLEDRLRNVKQIVGSSKKVKLSELFHIIDIEVNELCFGRTKSSMGPIYGALNCCSRNGGAPYFGKGECWLKLLTDKIKNRTTFTPSDSGDLTNLKWDTFSAQMACRIIKENIMDWEGAIVEFGKQHTHIKNLFLSRDLRKYVEAQIWGGVKWEDIEEIYIVIYEPNRNLETIVKREFKKRKIEYQSKEVCRNGIGKPLKFITLE